MNAASELIYLHNAMERLCKLYIAMQEKSDEEDVIQEIKSEIMHLYSEIMSIKKGESFQSLN